MPKAGPLTVSKGVDEMINNYETPEVVEIERAQNVILGSPKDITYLFEDSPGDLPRMTEQAED
jgi:hypothetical protein